ncbi:MAG: signal peptide peptidase SppA [Rikenellaceae bacterium]
MKFFKIFGAALLACIVSGVIGFLFWLILIFSAAGLFGSSEVIIEPNTIIKMELDEYFSEAPQSDPFGQFDINTMQMKSSLTLLDALTAIEAAAEDDNIEGIYLRPSMLSTVSTAALEEIRVALEGFKKSGKFIIAYNDIYTQGGYYLSSVADKVYVQPEGTLIWQGMASSTMFFKGLLDKLDISMEVFRPTACKYKSAVEPFILDKMSSANRAQMEQLMGSMWSTIASDVALSRGLSLEDVNHIADKLICMDVSDALASRMVDGLIYEDELPAKFREAGANIDEEDEDINYISFGSYATTAVANRQSIGAEKVAIIYAEGSIVDGEGSDAKVYGNSTAATIRKARLDDEIKAVVLRVNSPGGSALASDVMWRELELLRQEKPLVVSMGSYAASGGYYISAPADVIITNRLTLTGSIGVFGMMPNIEKALKTKLGITFDGVETNTSADFLTSLKGLSPYEKGVMVKSVDKVYTRFTTLVSEGRNLPLEKVLEIAQGRVWSGTEAVELGLADDIGGLREAITIAIDKAGIEGKYRIVEMTAEPTGLSALLSTVEGSIKALTRTQDPVATQYQEIIEAFEPLNTKNGMVMYSPYSVKF